MEFIKWAQRDGEADSNRLAEWRMNNEPWKRIEILKPTNVEFNLLPLSMEIKQIVFQDCMVVTYAVILHSSHNGQISNVIQNVQSFRLKAV